MAAAEPPPFCEAAGCAERQVVVDAETQALGAYRREDHESRELQNHAFIKAAKKLPCVSIGEDDLSDTSLAANDKNVPLHLRKIVRAYLLLVLSLGYVYLKCGVCYWDRRNIRPNDGGKHGYHRDFFGKDMFWLPMGAMQIFSHAALQAMERVFIEELWALRIGLNIDPGGYGSCIPHGACTPVTPAPPRRAVARPACVPQEGVSLTVRARAWDGATSPHTTPCLTPHKTFCRTAFRGATVYLRAALPNLWGLTLPLLLPYGSTLGCSIHFVYPTKSCLRGGSRRLTVVPGPGLRTRS